MLSTDKAIDMLPYLMDMYEKIDKKPFQDTKNKSTEEVGKAAIAMILKNLPKFKNEIYGVISIVSEKSIEEVKKQNITETIKQFKEIYDSIAKDKEIQGFFKSAVPPATQE